MAVNKPNKNDVVDLNTAFVVGKVSKDASNKTLEKGLKHLQEQINRLCAQNREVLKAVKDFRKSLESEQPKPSTEHQPRGRKP